MEELRKPFLLPAPKKFELRAGSGLSAEKSSIWFDKCGLPCSDFLSIIETSDISNPEAYRLEIDSEGIRIFCSDAQGAKYAARTIMQLLVQSEGMGLPALVIEDYPDLSVRGFMLDISRCKVPTMQELFWLVEKLALFKYNRLELYIEHTFAFEGHEIVWGDSSPMTPKQIRELDNFCNLAGIELVANLNGLGHLERWLRYPRYQHLAESKAPFIDPLGTVRKYPTTLYPDKNAIAFMDSLYEQYLPCFSSDKINIGGDEPWELGMGRSKERCQSSKDGKYGVYMEHILGLYERISSRGKKAYMWADVLMQKEEFVKKLPDGLTPILWGYYLDHPYEQQCSYLASLGKKFLVAPGTSTWNSFGGRWNCASENVVQACECAKKYSAEGALLTQWGDFGNHQAWCVMYPAIVAASAVMWGNKADEDSVCRALDKFVFEDECGEFSRALCELGRVDPVLKLFSFYQKLFFATSDEIQKLISENSDIDLNKIASATEFARAIALQSKPNSPDANKCMAEFMLAADMINFAINRSLNDNNIDSDYMQAELKRIVGEYERVWLMRARIGGLNESSARIRNIKPEIFS